MPFYKGIKNSGENNSFYGRRHTPESKEKMRLAKLGKKRSPESIRLQSLRFKGVPLSTEHRKKISQSQIGKKISPETIEKMKAHPNSFKKGHVPANKGKGFLCSQNTILRQRLEYRLWREAVWKRDDYTCKYCFKRGGKLHAHHMLSFAKHPQHRLNISNGITLCVPCHREFHFGLAKEKA